MDKDTIYRQAAIDALNSLQKFSLIDDNGYLHGVGVRLKFAIQKLEQLLSVQPERKKGMFIGTEFDGYADGNPAYYEWICSECGCTFEDDEPTYNFCPNCGCEIER